MAENPSFWESYKNILKDILVDVNFVRNFPKQILLCPNHMKEIIKLKKLFQLDTRI